MRTIKLAIFVACIIAASNTFAAPSSLNPDTAGVDIATPADNGTQKKADATFKDSCRRQLAAQPYDVEFCKKKCAAGEKKFCACAQNPCEKYKQEFEEEAKKAAEEQKPKQSTPPAGAPAQGTCDIPPFHRPNVPMEKVERPLVERVQWLMNTCEQSSNPNNIRQCHELCERYTQYDEAWRPYCDYCALGYKDSCANPACRGDEDTCKLPGYGPMISGYGTTENTSWAHMKVMCKAGPSGNPESQGLAGIATCRSLCDHGCSQYCNFCKFGYGEPIRNSRGEVIALPEVNCGPGKKRGVGYPGVPVGFNALFSEIPQNTWKGMFAELGWINPVALKNAFEGGALGNASEWDGIPTLAERDYIAVHEARLGDFYKKWWWESSIGGTSTNPVIVQGEDRYGYGKSFGAPNGQLTPGLHSYSGPPWNWPFWIDYRP